ncbi:MAG TPA: NADH:flavin oxidoreductase/NADH oxidase [Stellaceae bacterium]|nr:NADH:flavin oxidoreductase/NADH oxidase [Stellaceae bacterium]
MPSHLFTPITLGGVTLDNRIAVSPMCQYSAVDGSANDWHQQHLGSLALSGAGLLILEATAVEAIGRITPACLGLYSDTNEAALERIVATCRRWGSAKLGIQLAHAGRKASSEVPWLGGKPLAVAEGAWPRAGASPVPFGDWPAPEELDEAGLARIRDAFVVAARRADRLGFDLVELHGAHGYLLHSFLSPVANRRTDPYGGSVDNRMRFPLEVAAAVRAVWPRDKALGVRITGSDWIDGALTAADATAFARELERVGFDYVCVSSGGISPDARIEVGPGYQVPFAEAVKHGTSSIAVQAVGMIVAPQQAEAIIASGQADCVALARAFLDDPRWPWHAADALGAGAACPPQYARSRAGLWPGAALRAG